MKKTPVKNRPPHKEPPKQDMLQKMQIEKSRYFNLVGLAIIILLGIIIYSFSFKCSFHFDDEKNIVQNAAIRNLSDVKAWWTYSPARPVSMFSFVLNYHFNQLDAWYYHLVNLIIHLINSCLVWGLTILIFSSSALKDHAAAKNKNIIGFLAALLFVSHPLATQSVTYIMQRQTSMAAMFYFISLVLYMKARLSDKTKKIKYLFFAGTLISALLAIFSKENAFTLPFAFMLFEIFFLQTKKLSINRKDYRIIAMVTFFIGIIIFILYEFSLSIFNPHFDLSIFDPIPPKNGNVYTVTPLTYLFTQFSVIVKYIQLLIFPVTQNLDYDYPISTSFFELRTVLSFLLLLSMLILAIFLFKKHRIFSFGIFWFFLTLSIESSFIPIADLIYEHRTYLPSFGFFLILSTGIYMLLWNKYKIPAIVLFGIIIISNSVLTYQRNKIWKDEFTLWNDVVLKSPGKARPYCNRGLAYANLGQADKAISDYSSAIKINPEYAIALSNRGVAYGILGRLNEALADYTKALEIEPGSAIVYYNRGCIYGRLGQLEKAMTDYTETIRLSSDNSDAYCNRGGIYRDLGQMDKAISDFSMAIEMNPGLVQAYINRGGVFGSLGQWDNAIKDNSKAIEIDPQYPQAYYNRGFTYRNLGQWDKAIADLSKAIEMNPRYVQAYFYRGDSYGHLGQWERAIADYSKAVEIDPNFKDAYNNRNFAYRKLEK